MFYRLSTYIDEIEKKYIKARYEWEKLQKVLEDEEKRYNAIDWKMYTFEGQQAEYSKHNEIRKKVAEKLEELRRSFMKEAESIREHSDIIFNSRYQFTPKNVDNNGVALLQVGNLSIRDLMRLGADYKEKGNYTMYFLVASKLKESPEFERDKEAAQFWSEAEGEKNHREDHDIINDMVKLCVSGLRDEDYLSNGIDGHHGELFAGIRARADEVTSNTTFSPWD